MGTSIVTWKEVCTRAGQEAIFVSYENGSRMTDAELDEQIRHFIDFQGWKHAERARRDRLEAE